MKSYRRKISLLLSGLALLITMGLPLAKGQYTAKAADFVVANETEIVNAVSSASAPGTIIEMVADITMTSSLVIPAGKEIILTSDTGTRILMATQGPLTASGQSVIQIQGVLTIDGITVTHVAGARGIGINVFDNATFILENGAIKDNNNMTTGVIRSPSDGGGVSVGQYGTFIMNGGEISGNTALDAGAGVYVKGYFIMNDGEIFNNTTRTVFGSMNNNTVTTEGYGGGVCIYAGEMTMNGGKIYGNTAIKGGGIYAVGEQITSGNAGLKAGSGEIYNNKTVVTNNSPANPTTADGGGVYFNGIMTATYNVSGLKIHNNTAQSNGGGIYIEAPSYSNTEVTLGSFEIIENQATGRGGGIYVSTNSALVIGAKTVICDNTAVNGGGIYTIQSDYSNVKTSGDTVFSGNTATTAYEPPVSADGTYPDLAYFSTSIDAHPLNNADINYAGTVPTSKMTVFYKANGGTGEYSAGFNSGATVTVLSSSETSIVRSGYKLIGWDSEGLCCKVGTQYDVGDDFVINANIVLYARWEAEPQPNPLNLTYDANGGTGGKVFTVSNPGDSLTILSAEDVDISRDDYRFVSWNTEADGSGTRVEVGVVFTLNDNVTLYAQWEPISQPGMVSLTYNANGGTGGKLVNDIVPGTTVTVLTMAAADVDRQGYRYIAWNTASDGTGIDYTPGATLTVNADMVLYAQWEANNNGGSPDTGDVSTLLVIGLLVAAGCLISYLNKTNKKKLLKADNTVFK